MVVVVVVVVVVMVVVVVVVVVYFSARSEMFSDSSRTFTCARFFAAVLFSRVSPGQSSPRNIDNPTITSTCGELVGGGWTV